MATGMKGNDDNVMAEGKNDMTSQQKQSKVVQTLVEAVTHTIRELFYAPVEVNGDKPSLITRAYNIVRGQGPRLINILRCTSANATHWMCQAGPWRAILITSVAIVSFASLAGVVVSSLLLLTTAVNGAIASFLMSVSMVGVFMAFFFSSVSVIYMGALGFGGLTISSIAFLSVCGVIFFSGWIAIAWVIWQALRKCFQFARRLIALSGSAILPASAAQRLQNFTLRVRYSPTQPDMGE